ncbi:hypothetical protein EV421DRAFT_1754486 [Armillaria borealis]|uniref:Uncharacterized protein n=1 Tax=Armillaria borealis TaxID=47425 RepID=A0AA39K8X4_9AGAR|nr:hypothetical protein EV421DRAFT_1754486 [Armillaria borealis]
MNLLLAFMGLSTRTDLEPYSLILQASSFRLQVSDYIEVHGSILSEFFQVAPRLMLPNYQRCMSASVVTCKCVFASYEGMNIVTNTTPLPQVG